MSSLTPRREKIGLLPLSVLFLGAIAAIAWIGLLTYGFARLIGLA
jgi:hypothetical protein